MESTYNYVNSTLSYLVSCCGISPPQANPEDLFSAIKLHQADELERILEEYKVDLAAVDHTGNTLLHSAVEEESETIVKILLDHARNDLKILTIRDRSGHTPLMSAGIKGNVPAMKALMEAGANLDNYSTHAASTENYLEAQAIGLFQALKHADDDIFKALDFVFNDVNCASNDSASRGILKALLKEAEDPLALFKEYSRAGKFDRLWPFIQNQLIEKNDLTGLLDEALKSNNNQLVAAVAQACSVEYEVFFLTHYALTNEVRGIEGFIPNIENAENLLDECSYPAYLTLSALSMMDNEPYKTRLAAMQMLMLMQVCTSKGHAPPRYHLNNQSYPSRDKAVERASLLLACGASISEEGIRELISAYQHRVDLLIISSAQIHARTMINSLLAYCPPTLRDNLLELTKEIDMPWVDTLTSAIKEFSALD